MNAKAAKDIYYGADCYTRWCYTDCYLGGSRESLCDECRLYIELFVSAATMRVVPV
jgi:hypothetical protein